MKKAAADRPPPRPAEKPKSQLTRDTRVGEVYWCDFSPMNWPPEFDDQHLVVILRGGKIAGDIHVVTPLTKSDQSANPHGYQLAHNPNPGSAKDSWAVCNHVYSVASERLKPLRDGGGNRKPPEKLHPDDLHEISRRVRNALNTFLALGLPPAPTT
ncbi:type II toxin-antitoxin system PemK/MazF family toxin [Brevundimonas sp. GCM10030266]|uniref:type II toxin-antitoxin system PemK/MazF family toxin n=1 Tax=Brevundimonas sp. GCM10030266 TaxID=3273386 RepID=UPI0036111966